jgi:hypothetical protein
VFFSEAFDAMFRLCADPEASVQNAVAFLDNLVKVAFFGGGVGGFCFRWSWPSHETSSRWLLGAGFVFWGGVGPSFRRGGELANRQNAAVLLAKVACRVCCVWGVWR